MTNRELETRYMHMKQTWKTLVDANVNLVDENKDLKEEIERLNNIINEFEKWLKDYIKLFDEPDMLEEQTLEDLKEVLDKIQELKGSDKE